MDIDGIEMIPGAKKLIETTVSGLGSVSSSLIEPWKAEREGKAKIIAAKAESEITKIRAQSYADARVILGLDKPIEDGELEISKYITEKIHYQDHKRLGNTRNVVKMTAIDLEDKEVPDIEPDHDWTARFFNEVQDVSSEQMQVLWAKVLAGEVERPGSTSVRTLGILKALDQETAALFTKLCSACIYVFPEDGRNMAVAMAPALSGKAANNSLNEFGFNFLTLSRLNEYGLIISDFDSWIDIGFSILRESIDPQMPLLPFHHQERKWLLVADTVRTANQILKIKGPSLSLAGRELSRIVGQEPLPEYTERLKAHFLHGHKFNMMLLSDVLNRGK